PTQLFPLSLHDALPIYIFAALSLVWAVSAPAFVFLRAARQEQSRKLSALAASRLGASAVDMTNEVIRVPRASVELIGDLAQEERSEEHTSELQSRFDLV